MKNTVVVPVRMPVGLKERVDVLARKGLTTRNHWIVNALAKKSRWLSKPRNLPE